MGYIVVLILTAYAKADLANEILKLILYLILFKIIKIIFLKILYNLHQIKKKYKVPSQTGWHCRNGLEIIENILVNYKKGIKYNYCETGSYLGGTLFPRLNTQDCSECLSIDKRVNIQLDERQMEGYSYKGIKTSKMIYNLKNHLNKEKLDKLECFDGSIQEFTKNRSNSLEDKKYDWIFIDAEHTNIASFDDFLTSMSLISKNGVIALHDNWMIFSAISNICSFLDYLQIKYRFVHVDGDISAFFLGEIADFSKNFDKYFITTDKNLFFKNSRDKLWKSQTYQILRKPKSIFISLKIVFGNYIKRIINIIYGFRSKVKKLIR